MAVEPPPHPETLLISISLQYRQELAVSEGIVRGTCNPSVSALPHCRKWNGVGSEGGMKLPGVAGKLEQRSGEFVSTPSPGPRLCLPSLCAVPCAARHSSKSDGRGLGACCISNRQRLTTIRVRGLFESIASDSVEHVIHAGCRNISFSLAV